MRGGPAGLRFKVFGRNPDYGRQLVHQDAAPKPVRPKPCFRFLPCF